MRVRLFLCLFLLLPGAVVGDDRLAVLGETELLRHHQQPGLERYSSRISLDNFDALYRSAELSSDTQASSPLFVRYWQKDLQTLLTTMNTQPTHVEQQLVAALGRILSGGIEAVLIPPDRTKQRKLLADKATVKVSETQFGDTRLKRVELTFTTPEKLQEAFYSNDLPLPQDRVTNLYLDIDADHRTIQELGVLTADGLKLTLEMRYLEIAEGFLPARIKVTSFDGQIDDLVEVHYEDLEGFTLPTQLTRVINRPDRQETLNIRFDDYRINQPFPARIQDSFDTLH